MQEGRQQALLFWERRAIAMAEGAPGNAQLIMLALKNRSRAASGWHDAQRLEHTGGDGGPVQVQPVLPGTVPVLAWLAEEQGFKEATHSPTD